MLVKGCEERLPPIIIVLVPSSMNTAVFRANVYIYIIDSSCNYGNRTIIVRRFAATPDIEVAQRMLNIYTTTIDKSNGRMAEVACTCLRLR